ncbi:unnamed protein product [Clavelina lepadiformis]|uniref:WD repeat-containing protein 44 n=1 Tax=Clavelina lepadiformis TaxID=159417 RepID=A0ABP0EZM6_CLALP
MSYASDSGSDDFYDARQELGSPRSLSSPPLLVDADDNDGSADEQAGATENQKQGLNSPSQVGGNLSLDHILSVDSEEQVVIDDATDKESVIECDGPSQQSTFESIHQNIMTSMTAENIQECASASSSSFLNLDKCDSAPPPVENPSRQPTLVVDFASSSDAAEDIAITSVLKSDASNHKAVVVDPQSQDEISEQQSNATLGDAETEGKTVKSSTCNAQQQPDIVMSSKERPSNLPGVLSLIIPERETETSSKHGKAAHSSIARPKRPPPPRPKNPPKRPPPPRNSTSAASLKPYLSSVDDGLLTPNSTVDNITREFAAVLQEETSSPACKVSPSPQNICEATSLPAEPPKQDSGRPRMHEDSYGNQRNNSSKSYSLGRNSKQCDEEKQWSQMTKSTILRIDSSPGLEILSTVIVRNLDTGQTMPLSAAAEQVSQCLNPLALQIMSRTKEFTCASGSAEDKQTAKAAVPTLEFPHTPSMEEDTASVASDEITIGADAASGKSTQEGSRKMRVKSKRLKNMMGKGARRFKEVAESQVERAVQKVKQSKADGAQSESLHVSSDEEVLDSLASMLVKTKQASSHKGPYQFSHPRLVQDIAVHIGAVWSMKFSHCGRLLATAGQNNIIWIWVLKDYYAYFNELRNKYDSKERGAVFATPPRSSMEPPSGDDAANSGEKFDGSGSTYSGSDQREEDEEAPFQSLPFSSYVGHTADVLDLAWSKNYFTLSSSMDKTVRLWHVSQKECLCCFQHIDFVTAISFHPRDDRYFLSGSLDSKLRLWNIPEKKVALWNEVTPDSSSSSASGGGGALITTVNFCENGKFAVCGTYDGRCLFYDTEHLKYHTQIHVRSSRGRNSKGHKITGIEPLPGEHKILVTSNDSRVRLYDLRDLSLTCKFKGLTNLSSQIKASFSHDNKYIICGSEDKALYIWMTNPPQDVTKLSSFRRDRNDSWESIRAHDAVVTCAIFAPYPHLMVRSAGKSNDGSRLSFLSSKKAPSAETSVIISADFKGVIKVFTNL